MVSDGLAISSWQQVGTAKLGAVWRMYIVYLHYLLSMSLNSRSYLILRPEPLMQGHGLVAHGVPADAE